MAAVPRVVAGRRCQAWLGFLQGLARLRLPGPGVAEHFKVAEGYDSGWSAGQ